MKTTLNKKTYEKPFTRVFLLQRQSPLVCTSDGNLGNPGDYEDGGDPFNPIP